MKPITPRNRETLEIAIGIGIEAEISLPDEIAIGTGGEEGIGTGIRMVMEDDEKNK